ncbi:interleukin-10 receptor subunit beta-like isoform X2 [Neoarius graeffei]|uniref:interleukin-10 receptor subunit beta-like isoform X2 n=1 Tax=Neoarius graeffei TaxID=443677 RepID=UPI00298C7DC7|nr:interleukin-10 receptor subunit beta-like isoform X2 [Neoarius graeffei]
MRILSLLCVYFLVFDSEGTVSVPAPVEAEVLSNNFIQILQWSPGKGTQPGTVYNVNVGNNQRRNINGTSIDISEYMKDIFHSYKIQLWASFGNSSSSIINISFSPWMDTTIGPPKLSLSGCGTCLNISIDLPNRQDDFSNFYNAIYFNIHWRKVADEKDDCNSSFTNDQSISGVSYSNVLSYLEPDTRYCVQVQPMTVIPRKLLNSCACEFTSRIEPRGVAFLAGCVVSAVLVGLCFLSFIFSLIYTGFLCKPSFRLPKALIFPDPGHFLSPEETYISVAEVEYGIQIHKPENDHHKKKEKGNGVHKNSDDDDVDEDDDEDEEGHRGYMDRAAHSKSESTGSRRSAYVGEVEENPERCSFEDMPTDTKETLSLSQFQHDGVKAYSQADLLEPVMKNLNPPHAKEWKKLGGQMKEEEKNNDSGNVNLWSVVLKSMHSEEEEANEPSEAKQPLLPLVLKELQEDSLMLAKPQTGSSSELHTVLLLHTQTSQELKNDTADTSVCDRMQTGYMASHTGAIDTGSYESEEEEEDYTSSYMTR